METGEQEGNDWLIEQLYNLSKGKFINPIGLTLGEWLVEWLQIYSKQNVRQRTFERYISLAKHCEPLAAERIQDLKPNHFQNLYVSLGKYSGETRKKVHNLLHQALDQAVNDQLIPFNPISSVTPPKVIREEVITFRKEELEALLDKSHSHRWYPALLLTAHTGMRLGEVLGLRWMDIDFTAKCVNVRQTLQHTSTGIKFEAPKSKAGKRKISIPAGTIETFREYRKNIHKAKLNAIYEQIDEMKQAGQTETLEYKKLNDKVEDFFRNTLSQLCFTSANETPIQPKNFERWWTQLQLTVNPEWQELEEQRKSLSSNKKNKEYIDIIAKQKAAKDSRHKKFHAIRHTHATELLASGENIMDVARRLGHSKASTTLDIYGHAIPGNDEKIATKIGKLYSLKTEKSQLSV